MSHAQLRQLTLKEKTLTNPLQWSETVTEIKNRI